MNTYRVYVLDTKQADEPKVHVVYVKSEKYDGAWKGARAALAGKENAAKLFADKEGKEPSKVGHGDHVTVAKIDDIRPRNVKVDKAALQAILNDPKASAEDKLKAMQASLGMPA